MALDAKKYARKPFVVEAVEVTEENWTDVATWCKGELVDATAPDAKDFHIKVKVARAMTERQTQAFVGDWVLKAGNGFKVYTAKAFSSSFELQAPPLEGTARDNATQSAKPQPPKPAPVEVLGAVQP